MLSALKRATLPKEECKSFPSTFWWKLFWKRSQGIYNNCKIFLSCFINLLSSTLKEESNAEETFAIFANSGKFAKVWCREIFYFREFAKVYSLEKFLFSIRKS